MDKREILGNCPYCGGNILKMNGQNGYGEYCDNCGYNAKNYDEDYSYDDDYENLVRKGLIKES